MIIEFITGLICFAVLLGVVALEGQLTARVQARVGFRVGWAGIWNEPMILARMMLQRNQTLPVGGKAWLILWCFSVAGMVGLLPWAGDGDFVLLGLPVLAVVSSLSLQFMSTGQLAQAMGALVPLILAILTVGLDAGGYSWSLVLEGEGFPLGARALSRPSMALGFGVFWVSAQSVFGLSPLSVSLFETEYRRGTSGAVVRLGRAAARLTLAALTTHLFFGSGGVLVVAIKSGLLVLITHLMVASLPRLRSDQWMRVGWKILFGAGVGALLLRNAGL